MNDSSQRIISPMLSDVIFPLLLYIKNTGDITVGDAVAENISTADAFNLFASNIIKISLIIYHSLFIKLIHLKKRNYY